MGRFNFVSPGAAATDELKQVLAEREAKRRQDFLDSITQRRENRTDEIQHAQLKSIEDQRASINEQRNQTMATGVAGLLKPHQKIDEATDQTLTEGNLGMLVQRKQDPLHEALGAGQVDTMGPNGQLGTTQAAPVITNREFAGTPGQLKVEETQTQMHDLAATLKGVTDRQQAARLAIDSGVPPAQVDDVLNAYMGKAETHSAIHNEWQDAVKSGYKGDFTTYQNEDANRKKPVIQMTDAGFSRADTVTFNQVLGKYRSSKLVQAAARTPVLEDSVKAIRENPSDPTRQLNLGYSWIQALDTYQSAVREGELQNIGSLGTYWQKLYMEAQKALPVSMGGQGAVMPPEIAQAIADNSERLIATINAGKKSAMKDFASQARVAGVGDMWDQYVSGINDTSTAPGANPPMVGPPQAGAAGGNETPEARAARLRKAAGL
jgi:hypothetical protein